MRTLANLESGECVACLFIDVQFVCLLMCGYVSSLAGSCLIVFNELFNVSL